MVRKILSAFGVALLLCGIAEAGVVKLVDGKKLEGVVMWTAEGKISVTVAGKGPQVVELKDVSVADFDLKEAPAKVEEGWQRQDLGSDKMRGSIVISGGSGPEAKSGPVRITVKDSTYGFRVGKRATDNCLYAYQQVDSDFEVTARILLKDDSPWARGGIMVREALDVDGPMVMVARGGEWGGGWSTVMLVRENRADRTEMVAEAKVPVWGATYVKLVRKGDTYTAFDSADGKTWVEVGSKKVRLTDTKGVLVGIASSGGGREGTVVYDKVTIVPMASGESERGEKRPDAYVMMRGGSVIAGEGDTLTDKEVKVRRPGGGSELAVPVRFVSRMVYAAISREMEGKLEKMGPGILMLNGDVLEGDVKKVEGDVMTISSVVFGLTKVEQRKVAGVVLRDVSPTEGEWVVRLQDGSVLQARGVTGGEKGGEKGKLVVEELQVGGVKVGLKDIVEVVRKK